MPKLSSILSVCLLTACAAAMPPVDALETGDRFGQWTALCGESAEETKPGCQIFQRLVTQGEEEEERRRVLRIAVEYLEGRDQPLAKLILPLGIWLPKGVTLKVDERDQRRVPVQTCGTQGCRTAVELNPETLAAMEAGETLEVTVYDGRQQPLTLQVSLDGFRAGMAALKR